MSGKGGEGLAIYKEEIGENRGDFVNGEMKGRVCTYVFRFNPFSSAVTRVFTKSIY